MKAASGDSIGYSLLNFTHGYGAPWKGWYLSAGWLQHALHEDYSQTVHQTPRIPPMTTKWEPIWRRHQGAQEALYRIMVKKRVLCRLWDFGLVWVCETGNFMVTSSRYADGRTSIKIITGTTPDIASMLILDSMIGSHFDRTQAWARSRLVDGSVFCTDPLEYTKTKWLQNYF